LRKPVPWADESHRALAKCRVIGKIARKLGPPQLTVSSDPFASLVRTITSQQVSGAAADTIYSRVEKLVGKMTPDRILAHDVPSLRTAGLSQAKSLSVIALSERASNGLNLRALTKCDAETALQTLTEIKGIGPWTVEMFLMFCAGHPDVMSAGDLGLRKGLAAAYRLDAVPKQSECEELFERWRPWRTAAAWYLWRIVDEEEVCL
jgi:DNA-3-methyladenine glycosylase II